ncbi:MAG: succinylglutamate desuccinylase/aspartoacylase family protein [Anaerolineae bacterium]
MASKTYVKLPVVDVHNGHRTFVPLGIVEGARPGPTLAAIGAVHATEYSALEGVHRFWRSLEPEKLAGRVLVVLAADVAALSAHTQYTNPIDGKNLNRVWPGKADGTLTEVIAYTITQEVILKADAVIDCHGGEYDEAIDLFIITHATGDAALDKRTLDLSLSLGMPFVEVTDASGAVLGRGTGAAEAIRSGRPAATLEAGGRGALDERHISAVYNSLHNAARFLGIEDGAPVLWAGQPVKIDHGILLRTTELGLYQPAVSVGDWIEQGGLFARVLDFDGSVLEEICAPEAGVVLDVIVGRAIKAGGFAGKIGVL